MKPEEHLDNILKKTTNIYTPHQEIPEWEKRFDEMKKGFISVKQSEWWSSDEDYIKDFIRAEIESAEKRGYEKGIEDGNLISFDTGFLAGQKAMVEQIKKKYGEDFTMEVPCGTENMLPVFRIIDLNEALQTLEDNLNQHEK